MILAAALEFKKELSEIFNAIIKEVHFKYQVSGFAADALRWVVEWNIIAGKDGRRLDPRDNATRVEIAAVLYRYLT